ncbi:Os04g0518200 [Oryza sativa Japonica Group]|uniref:Os04g0518200 protein n=1 Tax=Oryza sativa subsp. japonica TaxID=39947 RepID=C7J0W7_ORYSJ|nr:Os04g0518200 [Oryza sativa Japonica Group]|eukprot:NP_001174017.1 Os04g0518200 [Oryza sativa Japonica Group]
MPPPPCCRRSAASLPELCRSSAGLLLGAAAGAGLGPSSNLNRDLPRSMQSSGLQRSTLDCQMARSSRSAAKATTPRSCGSGCSAAEALQP